MGRSIIKHRKSFTLIEVIVVIAVIGLIIPAVFSILFAVLRQQVKVYRLNEVKKEGDAVLKFFETKIRNEARSIYRIDESCGLGVAACPICVDTTNNPLPVHIFNSDANLSTGFGFTYNNAPGHKSIQYYELPSTVNELTDPRKVVIKLDAGQSTPVTCKRVGTAGDVSYSEPTVRISFTICAKLNDPDPIDPCKPNPSGITRPEETASLYYTDTIQLRSKDININITP